MASDDTSREEFIDSILRGELPDELSTVFQQFRPDVFSALLAAYSYLFVLTHEEVRQRYAPSVPSEFMYRDLIGWLADHMGGTLSNIRKQNPGFQETEHEAIQSILLLHGQTVDELLRRLIEMDEE